jgi:hypothetical protein
MKYEVRSMQCETCAARGLSSPQQTPARPGTSLGSDALDRPNLAADRNVRAPSAKGWTQAGVKGQRTPETSTTLEK